MHSKVWDVLAVLLLACVCANAGAQVPAAGEVTLLTGRATASSGEGVVRILAKGDQVYSGEVSNSGVNSYVNLQFADGGLMLLRPRTRFLIEQFSYQPAAAPAPAAAAKPAAAPPVVTAAAAPALSAPSRAFFRLLKGGFRAVSGLIGKVDHAEYRIATPVATIGIRGTDFYGEIISSAFARDPVLQRSLPPGISAEGGLYVQQFEGATEITSNSGQKTFLGQGQNLVTLGSGEQTQVPQPKIVADDPPPDPQQLNCK